MQVIELGHNAGAAARTVGARALDTPVVAFSDDDSWWAPGALRRIADAFAEHASLGLVAARILVGDDERLDPTCARMDASPLRQGPGLPGSRVLGFVACGAAVRRTAFLEAGGFHPRMGVGGEETLLALDLAVGGWDLAYLDDVVAHHHPQPDAARAERDVVVLRNRLWAAWLRRPAGTALGTSARALAGASPSAAAAGLRQALRGAGWIAQRPPRRAGRARARPGPARRGLSAPGAAQRRAQARGGRRSDGPSVRRDRAAPEAVAARAALAAAP